MHEPVAAAPAFRDTERTLDDRVASFVKALVLPEKLAMLHEHAGAVERLGIAAHVSGGEIVHGLSGAIPATVFPQAIGLGATWNAELMARIGSAIGDEVRVISRDNPEVGLNVWGPVVNLLRDPRWGRNEEGYSECPVLTSVLATSLCSGLTSATATRTGGSERESALKTAPVLKHFVAYNHETDRATRSANLTPRTLWEYELKPFAATISGGVVAGVMLAYSKVNGRPNHISPAIRDILRVWDPNLLVISDAWAPTFLAMEEQAFFHTRRDAYAAALNAGLDIFVDQEDNRDVITDNLRRALDEGLVTEDQIDAAVGRFARMRLRLGEFDPPEMDPFRGLSPGIVNGPEHRALAAQAAREAIVLLGNRAGILPLERGRGARLAVLGPLADELCRDWYGGPFLDRTTPLTGIRAASGSGGDIAHSSGGDRIALRSLPDGGHVTALAEPEGGALTVQAGELATANAFDQFDWGLGVSTVRAVANGRYVAVDDDGVLVNDQAAPHDWYVPERLELIEQADGWVLRSTSNGRYVTVAGPRRTLTANAVDPEQAALFAREVLIDGVEAAAELAAGVDTAVVVVGNNPLINGREGDDRTDISLAPRQEELVRAVVAAAASTVVVLVSGYPLCVPWIADHAPAVVWTCHAGPALGDALAAVLFGDYAPAGRLPQTWPRSVADCGDLFEYDIMRAGKTYLYSTREPLYPFGHGLTYTRFWYGLRLHRPVLCEEDKVCISVEISNVGDIDSDEVVQIYVRGPRSRHRRPHRQLCLFRRVRLPAGGAKSLYFELPVRELAVWSPGHGRFVVEPGEYQFLLGRSATEIVASDALIVRAEPIPPRSLARAPVRALDFDDYAGFEPAEETPTHGDAASTTDAGSWLLFQDVELSAETTELVAWVSRTEAGWAALEVRLDDPGGPLLGVLPVVTTGERHAWARARATVRSTEGCRDVYLVSTGALRISHFQLCVDDARRSGEETGCLSRS